MTRFETDTRLLVPFETFDPAAFMGDATWPQQVCDLVLALALAYNDFKDLVAAHSLLFTVAPRDLSARTPECGQYSGLNLHLSRTLAGMLHELMRLLQKNYTIVQHPTLQEVVRKLHPDARTAWNDVVAAATAKPSTSSIATFLVRVRNQVAFHYDPERIAEGYRNAFLMSAKAPTAVPFVPRATSEPLASRGKSMAQTRFYFADASAAIFMRDLTDTSTTVGFFSAALPLLAQINHALRELVLGFVTTRRFAWRPPNPDLP